MKSSRQYRNSHGQALAEGAAALILLTAIIVGGVLLILGTGTLAYYKIKLATVTSAVAKVAVDGRYWLGAQRPDFNATTVQNNATTLATDLLGKAGFPSQVISSTLPPCYRELALVAKLRRDALPQPLRESSKPDIVSHFPAVRIRHPQAERPTPLGKATIVLLIFLPDVLGKVMSRLCLLDIGGPPEPRHKVPFSLSTVKELERATRQSDH